MTYQIKHDNKTEMFYINISGEFCTLKYRKISENTLDFYATFVPDTLRGQGIAGAITKHALEYAKSHRYYIIPSCPYVESYIEHHPQYKVLIKK